MVSLMHSSSFPNMSASQLVLWAQVAADAINAHDAYLEYWSLRLQTMLERGARHALVLLFGEGWCTSEFAGLVAKVRESLLNGVGKQKMPANAFALHSRSWPQ
jgi:hypothetical protein